MLHLCYNQNGLFRTLSILVVVVGGGFKIKEQLNPADAVGGSELGIIHQSPIIWYQVKAPFVHINKILAPT